MDSLTRRVAKTRRYFFCAVELGGCFLYIENDVAYDSGKRIAGLTERGSR